MDDEEFKRAGRLEYFKSNQRHHETLAASLVGFMQSAIRVAFLLNGGAVIAALSLLGALEGEAQKRWTASIPTALYWWVGGLIAATVSVFLIGIAQRQFQAQVGANINALARNWFGIETPSSGPNDASGQCLRCFALALWLTSIVAFGVGAFTAIPQAPN